MTHDILPADVDLANKLRSAGHSDEAVITALVSRGIDRGEATQLLDDLRNGRPVKTKMQKGLESTPRRRHRQRSTEAVREESSGTERRHRLSPSSRREHPQKESTPRSEKKTRFRFWPWVLIFSVGVGAALGSLIFFNHGHFLRAGFWANRFATTASARELPLNGANPPEAVSSRGFKVAPADLALEFRPTGLHLGEAMVTRGNALKVFSNFLGSPTRTIPGKTPGAVNYAFDPYGLVICGSTDGVSSSILLDCDAVGGATGTKSGFAGLVRVEDAATIRADIACAKLAAISKLGLSPAGLASGILDGRYQNLSLVFVYLKSRDRLSAVEIDFP